MYLVVKTLTFTIRQNLFTWKVFGFTFRVYFLLPVENFFVIFFCNFLVVRLRNVYFCNLAREYI